MMNLREIKAMLKSEFGIKYLYELSQVDLIQNNEDLVLGIVKVELQVSHKRYVLGTFNVWNAQQEVSKRQVKKYMAYFDKIETWFADKQEVDVRVFNDEQYQYTRKVKRIEVVPCETIEETQEEQQNEQLQNEVVPCGTIETQEEQEEETITFLNNEGHVTSAVIVSKDNPYLREQCNHDLIQTTDGKYWELWTTYNGYLVAIDTDEYDQTETQVEFDFDNNCEYCGTIHNVEFRQTTLLGKYAFVCEHCLENLNTETQETSYNYGKDSVDAQSVSRSEYCEKLKPFTNYVEDMARYHRHDYNELIKTEYNTTKKALELFTVGEFAFIPNTLDGKKEYLKGMLDTTKKDIKNLVLNNDEGDYEALELFYRLHAQLESTKGLLNELCGFKNEMILR